MGFNLQNERIQDTYQQLVQISGSTLVDGDGVVISSISNISSVSSSYALTASYAENASTATTAGTADTASYIDPTFISASAAAAGFGSGGGAGVGTLQQVTDEGASTDNDILLTNPNGNQRITIGGSVGQTYLQGNADYITTFDDPKISGFNIIEGVSKISSSAGDIDFINNDIIVVPDRHIILQPNNDLFIQPTSGKTRITGRVDDTGSIYIQTSSAAIGLEVNNGLDGFGPNTRRSSHITPQGFRTVVAGTTKLQIGSSTRGDYISSSLFNVSEQTIGTYTYGKWTTGEDGILLYDNFVSANASLAVVRGLPNDIIAVPQVYIAPRLNVSGEITASGIVSSSGGFIGDASGLTNLPFAGQNKFYEDNTYTFDLPGDANDPAYDIHISQSGVYFISASKVPPYGANGPKVNLYYWPELIGIGETAKVTFFIPNSDTGTGLSYKENVTGSASNEWYWSSTTSPAATATRNISRNLTFSQISTGTGTTTMVKDGGGRAFLVSSTSAINSTNYLYTGDSVNPLT